MGGVSASLSTAGADPTDPACACSAGSDTPSPPRYGCGAGTGGHEIPRERQTTHKWSILILLEYGAPHELGAGRAAALLLREVAGITAVIRMMALTIVASARGLIYVFIDL